MKLGLIVNPIAGMGGKGGLKGTDNVLEEAVAKGAEPVAPHRATEFLKKLKNINANVKIELVTCPKTMGEEEAKEADFKCKVLPMKISRDTSAEDTKTAAKLMATEKVDLIVFVGGDGTARDIFDAFNVKLYGLLKGPFLPAHIQGSKQVSPETIDEADNQKAIARFILEEIPSDATFILGPGTPVKRLAELLGVKKTILGVDIYSGGTAIFAVDEKKILDEIKDWYNVWIILSPIRSEERRVGK